MSNTFNLYTPSDVGEVAIGLLGDVTPLSSFVRRFDEKEYQAGRGNTVYLSVPGALTARTRALDETTAAIVTDSLSESREPVSLSSHGYSAVKLSESDLSLNLVDFGRQVLAPQVDAVAARVEHSVASTLAAVPVTSSISFDEADPVSTITGARRALRSRGVDVASARLTAIVGGTFADALLESGALDFAKTGNADALTAGTIGRLRGFDIVESSAIADDEAVFMTADAVYLATRAPELPLGAAFGARVSANGYSLRYLRDYDSVYTYDRSLVSTFFGSGVLPLYDVVRDHATGAASVTEVTGGAVVKISTAA